MFAFVGKNVFTNCAMRTTFKLGARQMGTTHTPVLQTAYTPNQVTGLKKSYQDALNRNAVHHCIFPHATKTPYEVILEERVKPLFDENCDPDLREYILRIIVQEAQGDDQQEQQSATHLLVRLSNDLNLDVPAINREYVTQVVLELHLSLNERALANQLAYETRKFPFGDHLM